MPQHLQEFSHAKLARIRIFFPQEATPGNHPHAVNPRYQRDTATPLVTTSSHVSLNQK